MRTTVAAAFGVAVVIAVGLVGLALAGGAVAVDGAAAQEATSNDHPSVGDRTVTVAGEGTASAPPDEAVVAVAVVAEGDDPTAVGDDLREGSEALRSALADAGVEDDQVETTDYWIRETWREPSAEEPDAPAYRGVHAYQVTLDDVDRAGPIVDASAEAGAEVRWVAFTLSDERRADVRDEALTAAMDDARRQAETLAAAGDLSLVGVRTVDAADRRGGVVFEDDAVEEAAATGTVIEPGDVTVRSSVRVTYDAAPRDREADDA